MNKNELSRRTLIKLAACSFADSALLLKGNGLNTGGAPVDRGTASNSLAVTDLRCEYAVDPLGIDEPIPRLSWVARTDSRSWKQNAYQILVASSKEILARGQADLWDSGKVQSHQTAQVLYRGKAIRSRQRCCWKVRVWDSKDTTSEWSPTAHWTMGLLTESDWQNSQWIGSDDILEDTDNRMWYWYEDVTTGQSPSSELLVPPPSKASPFLRCEFVLSGKVRSAYLFACGLAYAELHLNGRKIGGDVERDPAYTNFNCRVVYVTHDIGDLVAQGRNVIGAILGTGWYDVHDLAIWHFNTAPWRGRPRLRLLLAIEYQDGRLQFIGSDASWKVATGPISHDGIYTGEIYDARREMPGWDNVGFDDASWQPALIMPAPFGKLVARGCPPVAITETLVPVSISEPKPGEYIVDMGQNFSGHTQLRVRASAGTKITMRYGEVLYKDGTLNTSPIDEFMAKTNPVQPFQQDTYICKGKEEEVWEQRFSYSGFQYAAVTGFPGKPTPDNFRGRFAHTAFENAGEFACSNDVINKIQHATRWSYLSNAQSIPTDCPQREKNGWTGDAQLASETGLMNFRSASFYTKWLDDLADAQRADGGLPVFVPSGGWGNGNWCGPICPPWDAAYPVILWNLYQYCGDTRLLERHYLRLRRYVDFFSRYEKAGVTPGLGLGDWLPWKTQTPLDFISTAYLYLDAKIISDIAHILQEASDEQKYRSLAERVKQGFNAHFYKSEEHTYTNGSQTALSTALMFGLVPEGERQAVFAALVADVERQGHIDTGIIGAKNILHVLSEGGRTDLAYHIVVQQELPGWGYWVNQGATTLWETWQGEASRNHIMFGDVSNWFFRWLAGIGPDPSGPGFQRVLIRPTPVADLSWAKAKYDSIRGTIISDWERSDERFRLNLTIPANVTATVWIPAAMKDRVTENGKAAAETDGVRMVRELDGRKIFSVGSGDFAFEVSKS
jgi:alpha-L-rhamnosidase